VSVGRGGPAALAWTSPGRSARASAGRRRRCARPRHGLSPAPGL